MPSQTKNQILLKSKVSKKAENPRPCSRCDRENSGTWIFENTSSGSVYLCTSCKTFCIKHSFSHEALEKQRLTALKSNLKELKAKRHKQPEGASNSELSQAIYELELLIKKGIRPKPKWSPILSGSYGSGKRR